MVHIPLRMCIACRKMLPQNELIRVVANKDTGLIELDIHKKKFGRGAYVCKCEQCIKRVTKSHGFERHLKCAPSEKLYKQTEEMI
jgi:predicted RNA-binding protein YlxR (DUF448 family)